MTIQEFSNEFDVLYNNVMSNQAPGLDEYEKSVFLTKAQTQILNYYFEPAGNTFYQGYDSSVRRQYDFSTLMRTMKLADLTAIQDVLQDAHMTSVPDVTQYDRRSRLFIAPSDLYLRINETIVDSTGRMFSVLPITYDEYQRLQVKPYGLPVKRQFWRLITSTTTFYNSIGDAVYSYTEDDGTVENIYYVFRGKSEKKLRINVISTEGSSEAPVIEEYDDVIEITFTVNCDGFADYYSDYLLCQQLINRFTEDTEYDGAFVDNGLSEYLYPISLIAALSADADYVSSSNGYWSLNPDGETFSLTIEISPSVTETDEAVVCPVFELIGRSIGVLDYTIRYVKTPAPIILVNLSDINESLSIGGCNTISGSEMPAELHADILQRAVELAKASYTGDVGTITQIGQISGSQMNPTHVGRAIQSQNSQQ